MRCLRVDVRRDGAEGPAGWPFPASSGVQDMNLNLPNNKGYSGGEGRASGYAYWLNKPWR
jgi:hypothetical protein